jgi:hypothetical protein
MTRLRAAVAALVAVVTGTLIYGVLVGWHDDADVLLFCVGAVGYVWVIVTDSQLRGRTGAGWLAACILVAPIGLTAFLVVAVRDRIRGGRGIERFWAPGVRWCYLAAVGLAALALGLAVTQFNVAKPDLGPNSGFNGPLGGSCEHSAIGLMLGEQPNIVEMFGNNQPAPQRAAWEQFAQRCTAKAGRRMVASEVSLAGGLALALIGGVNQRRRRPAVPPPAPVTLAA